MSTQEARTMKLNGYEIKPGADLTYADLRDADLRDADLTRANLRGADLTNANGRPLRIQGLDSGNLVLSYANDSWQIQIGCWKGTIQELRELIAKNNGWPGATKEEIPIRRPILAAVATLCEAHIRAYPVEVA